MYFYCLPLVADTGDHFQLATIRLVPLRFFPINPKTGYVNPNFL